MKVFEFDAYITIEAVDHETAVGYILERNTDIAVSLFEKGSMTTPKLETRTKALREAMEWNWIDGDVPENVVRQCEEALSDE